jgi:hypothetical protein
MFVSQEKLYNLETIQKDLIVGYPSKLNMYVFGKAPPKAHAYSGTRQVTLKYSYSQAGELARME